jgi:hypothetical protein
MAAQPAAADHGGFFIGQRKALHGNPFVHITPFRS